METGIMRKALLLYSSNDGQTRTIVTHIGDRLARVMAVELYDIRRNPPQKLSGYDAVLIGAAIRYGHFHKDIYAYTKQHADILNEKPSAFLGVCLTARKPNKRTLENNAYLRAFTRKTPWQPHLIEAAAGALLYPRYRWYDRLAIRFIMRMTGGETDPTKEIVFTDWKQVDTFADAFARIVENE